MKTPIAALAWIALLSLVAVSAWAASHVGIGAALEELLRRPAQGVTPWFVATLLDTAFAFLWFWLWVAYRERNWGARLLWLVLIFGLGNIAMGAYVLLALRGLPAGARPEDLLARRATA